MRFRLPAAPLKVASNEVREEQRDLALGGVRSVGAVHEVLARLEGEVTSDRARRGVARIRRSHHRAHDLPRVGTAFDDHRDERPARDERYEVVEERLALVLGVVALRELGVDPTLVHGHDREALALETADDLADEAALDSVGLAEEQRAV